MALKERIKLTRFIPFLLIILGLIFWRDVYYTQEERDTMELRDSLDNLICIDKGLGWCFCKNRGDSEFILGTPHCSLLKDDVKIYKEEEIDALSSTSNRGRPRRSAKSI